MLFSQITLDSLQSFRFCEITELLVGVCGEPPAELNSIFPKLKMTQIKAWRRTLECRQVAIAARRGISYIRPRGMHLSLWRFPSSRGQW